MDNRDRTVRFYKRVFQWSLITLPYLDYLSLGGLLTTLMYLLKTAGKSALDTLTTRGFLLISGLMGLSALLGAHPGESLLQLANFLPFFLLFAVLPFLMQDLETLEGIAAGFVVAAIPINLFSLLEYLVKSPFLPAPLQAIALIAQWRSEPHPGRAMVRFDHPNVLASYAIVLLGLGLGLTLKQSLVGKPSPPVALSTAPLTRWYQRRPELIYIGTWANVLGIFCSGSRNGLFIAVVQLLLFTTTAFLIGRGQTRRATEPAEASLAPSPLALSTTRRLGMVTGLLGLGAIALASLVLGVGGRTVSASALAMDPRVGVWKIALDLIRERPLLGWGLGSYKWLYPDRMIDPTFPYIAHPHNLWLLLGCETGIPIMLGFTILIGSIAYRAARQLFLSHLEPATKALILSYLFAFGGYTAFALFDITFYDARINVINWVVLAGLYSLSRSQTNPGSPS